ncbi:protein turtle homolog A [Colossoma macropomum]|uniref:protein turtle homolog A n=1 Tax=Colossoma macropomum TaxID=42526 RepID=UPI0018643517|nr:protein turtle homolog A [Colossoma macropomum]
MSAMAMKRLPLPELIITAVVFIFGVADCVGPTVWGKQGGSALLKCSLAPAEGSSAPLHVVEWVRQGYDIPVLIKFGSYAPRVHPNYEGRVSLSDGTALRVKGLVLEDEGWYECRILLLDKPSDETRNGSWTLLSVTAPPVFVEAPPPVTEAFLGRPFTLKCVARGNPPPSIKWHKDGVLMKQKANVKIVNGSLSVGSVSRQTAGRYQCQASNSEGNDTRTIQLRVKGPPVIITPPKDMVLNMSQNALLQCQAEADPPNMTYVWMREEENVYHIESLKSRVKVMVDGTLLISSLIPGDSGNYTCMPTNGLPAPPSASAILTVQHPALVTQMPDQTFLPTGMRGVISCPLAAEPPLLRVDWTKDGKMLDLGSYPGWTLTSKGSIVIATANDDAAGVYTCTPYNSYGTMGQSKPTTVILQDPPSLRLSPREEYRQEVGRTLLIPCQADGDPPPKVTWTKIGSSTRSLYSVAVNGSLLLQPLSKEHYGQWECSVANRVATATARTTVLVLGTSPHAVSSVSVEVRVNQANISWEPGFDGGFTQTFSIWLKCACSEGDQQEWQSVPGPSSGTSLLVSGLLPSTEYQFSVLAQNKLGSGPFSEITTARTLNALPMVSGLEPPTLLSFNQSSEGVYLWWAAPSAQQPPIDNFILQSRLEEGEWLNLDEDISVNQSEMLVLGLQKNSNYELRLLSRRAEQLSLPSRSINVSTVGLGPTSSRLLEFVPQPLLAGLMGGMGFLCLALLLALATVCVIGHRRRQRRRKRMEGKETAL